MSAILNHVFHFVELNYVVSSDVKCWITYVKKVWVYVSMVRPGAREVVKQSSSKVVLAYVPIINSNVIEKLNAFLNI